jgi:hypothetical protein
MINANMKSTDVYTITKTYNDFGIEIETEIKLKIIDCFINLRSTEDKIIDIYSFELANYLGITADKTVVKGNILRQNNIDYKVVEVFNLLRNTQLLLKAVL